MKKIITTLILAAAVAASAFAQPKAIGGRLGYSGLEVDYQHYLGSPNFIQVNAGADLFGNFGGKAAALYNVTFAQPNWTDRGDWSWYAGAGISMGYVWDHGNKYKDATANMLVYRRSGHGFMFSIPVQVGLSYTFWFPLQLSVDVRPYLGLHTTKEVNYEAADGSKVSGGNNVVGFYNSGLWGFCPTLSVHYAF